MSGGYDPNAQPWTPQGGYGGQYQQGGGYPPQQQQQWQGYQQQQGGGGYQQGGYQQGGYQQPQQGGGYPQPQQQGGYQQGGYPQGGGYGGYGYQQNYGYPQQGGYDNYQQGGYGGQQQQYAYNQRGAPQQQQPQQQEVKPTQLQLGGGRSAPAPKKSSGGSLSLSGGSEPKKGAALNLSSSEPVKKAGGGSLNLSGDQPKKAKTLKLGEEEKKPEALPEARLSEKPAHADPNAESEKVKPTESQPSPADQKEKDATSTPSPAPEKKKTEQEKRKRPNKTYVRDPRPHYNIVFCGHVDAGKSTISGRLLMESGVVDEREIAKLKMEAQKNHREGWEYAYVLDVSEEERDRGKTHETGSMYFETPERRFTILDAPGHKAFVPSMIGGATQADIAVLVLSAKTGEFETGFEKGGQTREHIVLVKTCGVRQLVCVVNKMDDVQWDKDRYDEIIGKVTPYVKANGWDLKTQVTFMPVSGLTGLGLRENKVPVDWYNGKTLLEHLGGLNLALGEGTDSDDALLAVPIAGRYRDDGKLVVYGKVESGNVVVGDKLILLPSKREVIVEGITVEQTDIEKAFPGDNIHLKIKGVEEEEVRSGYVLTTVGSSLKSVWYFQARIVVLEVKNIISNASSCMLHIHNAQEEVSFHKLLAKIDRKTSAVIEKDPAFIKAGECVMARLELNHPLCVEEHKKFDKLGRFMLREDGKTIAVGVVTKLYETQKTNAEGEQ